MAGLIRGGGSKVWRPSASRPAAFQKTQKTRLTSEDTEYWLDGSREAAAIAFCELWSEFQFNTTGFPASKHGQMRAYMSELGLTDERNRSEKKDGKDRDEIFDD